MPDQTAIAFSVSQRAALIAWGASQPRDLGVRLTVDPEEAFEVAEVYHRHTGLTLWMLFAINGGVVVPSGADSNEWQAAAVKAALDKVLEQATRHPALVGEDTDRP